MLVSYKEEDSFIQTGNMRVACQQCGKLPATPPALIAKVYLVAALHCSMQCYMVLGCGIECIAMPRCAVLCCAVLCAVYELGRRQLPSPGCHAV